MVAHVVERAWEAGIFFRILVATDHEEVAQIAEAVGAKAILTGPAKSGTDRVAMAIAKAGAEAQGDVVLNLQGDEPAMPPENLRLLAQFLLDHPDVPMGTLALPGDHQDLLNPNVVKVVCDEDGRALYFSRAPIPFQRNSNEALVRKHLGLYGFQRHALVAFAALPEHPLELCEGLEQLRALAHGIPIQVLSASQESVAVDTPEDVPMAEQSLARRGGG